MRNLLLVSMLVVTGMTGELCAQNEWTYSGTRTKTELLFDADRAPSLRHRFIINLKNSNSVQVRVANKAEFEKLLNLDSIIIVVAKNLQLFKDSLQDEISLKRIDYTNDSGNLVKIRIRQHQPNGASFILGADGPALLKIEQDTLNIIGYEAKSNIDPKSSVDIYRYIPYHIRILINDVNKLESLADGTLNRVMNDLRRQWDDLSHSSRINNSTNLYADYNSPGLVKIQINSELHIPKWSLSLHMQLGLQNINNIATGSFGAGFELIKRKSKTIQRHYQLIWEPYFFFDKEPDNKFRMRRNDFVTFQFYREATGRYRTASNFSFKPVFSLGYLVRHSGNYFSNNTFKVGLPGAAISFITLQPEMIFHDLFKTFQPCMKLTVHFG